MSRGGGMRGQAFLEVLWKSLEMMIRREEHVNMRACTPHLRMNDSWSYGDLWCRYKKKPQNRQQDSWAFSWTLHWKDEFTIAEMVHHCWSSPVCVYTSITATIVHRRQRAIFIIAMATHWQMRNNHQTPIFSWKLQDLHTQGWNHHFP